MEYSLGNTIQLKYYGIRVDAIPKCYYIDAENCQNILMQTVQ